MDQQASGTELHIKFTFSFFNFKEACQLEEWMSSMSFFFFFLIYTEVELKYSAKGSKCPFLYYVSVEKTNKHVFMSKANKNTQPLFPICFSSLCARFYSNCSPTQQELPVTSCSDVSNGEQCSVKIVNAALLSLLGHYLETVDAVLLYSFQGLFFFLTCSTFCHRPHRRTLSSGCTVTGSHLSQGSSPASQVTTRMVHIQG